MDGRHGERPFGETQERPGHDFLKWTFRMPTLASELRNKLERVVIDARDAAEAGAYAALKALAVHEAKYYPHMSKQQQELRNHLRARARQLGDRRLPKPKSGGKEHEIDHLVAECAYEHWHRM